MTEQSAQAELAKYIPNPNQGYSCRVVSVTQPTQEITDSYKVQTPQDMLAWFARVSNAANQSNIKTGSRLIKRLIRFKEWSPLEMVHLEIELLTTRDIGRQILRHTSLRPQEFSQRYAQVPDEPIFRECRLQHPTSRQHSVPIDPDQPAQVNLALWWMDSQQEVWDLCMQKYDLALNSGMAKECARAILPEGLTPTRMFFSGSIRSWYHYTQLRVQEETQKEHRLIANACWDLVLGYFDQLPDHRIEEV